MDNHYKKVVDYLTKLNYLESDDFVHIIAKGFDLLNNSLTFTEHDKYYIKFEFSYHFGKVLSTCIPGDLGCIHDYEYIETLEPFSELDYDKLDNNESMEPFIHTITVVTQNEESLNHPYLKLFPCLRIKLREKIQK